MSKKVDDAALDALLDELDASSDEEENEEAAAAVMGRSIEATASEANTNELVKKMEEEMMALLLDDADHDEKEQKPFHRGNGVDRDENDGGMSTKAGEKGEHSASRNSNEKDTNAADQGLDNNNNNNVNVNDQMENAISNLLNGLSSGDSTLPNDMPDMAGISEMGEDIMEQMMNEFVSTIGKKDDFDGMIDGMMKQMLSKELMYEPMKNVCEKFPAWLANAKKTLPEEEYIRYGKQVSEYVSFVVVSMLFTLFKNTNVSYQFQFLCLSLL